MVGDTPDDVEAARRAGVASVGITTGVYTAHQLARADRVVSDLGDLNFLWDPREMEGVQPE